MVGRRPGSGLRITDRDLELLRFLARYQYATYPQIAAYLDTTTNALRQRFPRLRAAGLIEWDNAGVTAAGVWRPTRLGIKLSGLDLPVPGLSWGTAAHTLGLVDIGIRFERAGETVVTEREIRAADQRGRQPSDRMRAARSFHNPQSGGLEAEVMPEPLYMVRSGKYWHAPDMVLVRPPAAGGEPQSIAVELEMTHKEPARLRRILNAYKHARNIGYVIYYTHRKDIRDAIQRAADGLGISHKLEVRRFVPAESGIRLPTQFTGRRAITWPETPSRAAGAA